MQVPFAGLFEKVGTVAGKVWNPISQRLGRRGTIVFRYVSLVVLGIVVFLFALQATFPYERLKDRVADQLAGSYDVQINGVKPGLIPGNVTFTDITLKSRPTKPEELPMIIVIKEAEVKMGILPLLGMNASVDLRLKVGSPAGYGTIKGNLSFPKFGKGGVKVSLTGEDVPAASLPLQSAIGLPATGKLNMAIDLDLPSTKNKAGKTSMDLTKADGTIALSCPTGCTLGNGHTKLKPLVKDRSRQAMVGEGIDFDKLNITKLDIRAKFTPAEGDPDAHSSAYKPGKFEVTKFELSSPDGEVHVEYMMTMATTLDESMVSGCLKFKPDDSLKKTPEGQKMYTTISTTGAEKRADGLFHIKLTDRFKDMKRLNADCGAGSQTSTTGNGENFGTTNPSVGPAGSNHTPAPNMGAFANKPTITTMPNNGSGTTPPPPPPVTVGGSGSAGSGSAGSAGSAGSNHEHEHEDHVGSGAVPEPQNDGAAAGAGTPPPPPTP